MKHRDARTFGQPVDKMTAQVAGKKPGRAVIGLACGMRQEPLEVVCNRLSALMISSKIVSRERVMLQLG
jgi:hypothetical protein